MAYLQHEETLPDSYPALVESDPLNRWIISLPDFPELCIVGLGTLAQALSDAEYQLAWAIRRRREGSRLCPYPSMESSLAGNVERIRVAMETPPIIEEEG